MNADLADEIFANGNQILTISLFFSILTVPNTIKPIETKFVGGACSNSHAKTNPAQESYITK